MSYWVAGAVVVSAIGGAVSSKNASDKSADAAKKGIASTQSLANQARTDAINLFSKSRDSSQAGTNAALKFYQGNAINKINPLIAGNMAAQQVLGKGATQANNAILGLPTDMSFANQPRAVAADYSGITSAKIPALGAYYGEEDQQQQQINQANSAAAAAAAEKAKKEQQQSAEYILDPKNQVNNVKNLIKKIF